MDLFEGRTVALYHLTEPLTSLFRSLADCSETPVFMFSPTVFHVLAN